MLNALAENPSTPVEVLTALAEAHAGDSYIVDALGRNRSTPVGVLVGLLALSDNYEVRLGLARHPLCPEDILNTLRRDRDPFILQVVAQRT